MPFYKLFLVLVCSFVICNTSPFNSFYLHILSTFGKWMQWPTSLLRFHPSYDIRSGNRTLFRGTFCFLFLLFRYVVQRPSSVSFAECSNFLYVGGNLAVEAVSRCHHHLHISCPVVAAVLHFALSFTVFPLLGQSCKKWKYCDHENTATLPKKLTLFYKCLPPNLALLYSLDVERGGRTAGWVQCPPLIAWVYSR